MGINLNILKMGGSNSKEDAFNEYFETTIKILKEANTMEDIQKQMENSFKDAFQEGGQENMAKEIVSAVDSRFKKLLPKIFQIFDKNDDKVLDKGEIKELLHGFAEGYKK